MKREFPRCSLVKKEEESRKDPKRSKPIPSGSRFTSVRLFSRPFAVGTASCWDKADERWKTGKSDTRDSNATQRTSAA